MARVLYLYSQSLRADSPHARRTFQILSLLKEAGFAADLLTLPGGDPWPKGLAENIYVTSRVPFTQTLKPYGFGFRRAWATVVMALAAVRLFMQHRYEVVHCSDRAIRIGGLLSWLFGIKFVFEWRSTSGHDLISWARWRTNRFINSVKLVISDVPYTVPQLRNSGLYGRIACIQSLPHPSLRPLEPPAIRTNPQAEQFRVTAFSYDDKLNDLSLFCQALPHILMQRNILILIVGGTPIAAERLRQRLAHRYPHVMGSVRIRPKPIDVSDFVECIADADLVYFPVANGPIVPPLLLDTMACGRAIMATRCPAYETLLTHQNATLINSDIHLIPECIHHHMQAPTRCADLARLAEEAIRKERNPTAAISALRSCYTFILLEPNA
jgi:hypothetical protein